MRPGCYQMLLANLVVAGPQRTTSEIEQSNAISLPR
jgi:hypothetical protein